MRIAVSNIAWEPSHDAAITDELVAAGVTGVEIAPTKVWPDLTQVPPGAAHAYGRRWRAAGLPVVAAQSLLFGRPELRLFDDSRERLVGYLDTVLEICAAMGATALVFGSPRNRRRDGLTPRSAHAIAVDTFGRLAERAAALGTCLVLEPNPAEYGADFMTCAAEAAEVVRGVGSPGLGLHLDTACMALAGDDPATCAERYADLLRHVHLSEPELGPVGTADDRHAGLATALRRTGYAGHVSVEMRATGDPVAAVRRAARYAVKVFGEDVPAAPRAAAR